jgi:hypothetical protein
MVGRFRTALRLFPLVSEIQSSFPTVTVHRYEEEIAGRMYCIEVSAVSAERWRAQLARRPGMPAAMMPFYGPTPERAAQELSKWLTMLSPGPVAKS